MTKAEILKKEILRQYRSVRQFAMEMNISLLWREMLLWEHSFWKTVLCRTT